MEHIYILCGKALYHVCAIHRYLKKVKTTNFEEKTFIVHLFKSHIQSHSNTFK